MAEGFGFGRLRLPWGGPSQRVARRDGLPAAIEWRHTLRTRLIVCAAIFGLWTGAIEIRLLYLQVFAHAEMMALANRQQLRAIPLPAKRGEILDRNGRLLAYSVDADTIWADPSEVKDPDRTAAAICDVLDNCDAQLRRLMAERLRRKKDFVFLARQISPDEARRVKALNLRGLGFHKESRRYYPNKELAGHLLGYVGLENVGLAGLESTFDARIRGREGKMLVQTDARKHAIYTREERLPTSGDSLELTIDEYLQYIAERELRAGVEENRAAGGTAIIMEPATGEVLAMANWPNFNPNAFNSADADARRNRAVQDVYEPGSTFKVVTASAAIEEHVIGPEDPVDCAPGYITFGPRRIDDTHPYGTLPFIDVIAKSSNVGAIRVGARLGPERLVRYVSRFGFGQALAPDFRGESSGIVWSADKLNPSALASVSMGYQVSVTPLQMATAVSAVANGGELVQPRVVRAFVRDGHREEVPHKVLRRAISPETAETLTGIMEAVVERGTAKLVQIEGYTIAGKTGTAQKAVRGGYSKSDYNASFVGFVPSRKPALTILVVIDSPHAKGYYGAVVAGPIFKRIAEAALRHLGIAPNVNPAPPVVVAERGSRETPLAAPVVRRPVSAGPPLELTNNGMMPDLRGLSMREAIRVLNRAGMRAQVVGNGFVLEHTPAAGEPIVRGDACLLRLGRRPPVAGASGAQQ